MRFYILLGVFIVNQFFSSCHFKKPTQYEEQWKEKAQNTIHKFYGKRLILPQNVELINGLLSNRDYFSAKLKVVSYIDGTCGACILDLKYWKKFINKINKLNIDCKFIFYIYASDVNDIKKLLANIGFEYPWFFDKDCLFIEKNELFDKRLQTFLVKNDSIILIGSPVLNSKLDILYFKTIKQIENE